MYVSSSLISWPKKSFLQQLYQSLVQGCDSRSRSSELQCVLLNALVNFSVFVLHRSRLAMKFCFYGHFSHSGNIKSAKQVLY